MGLLSRLRTRLRPPAPTVGAHFTPSLVEAWDELEEQVDGELKKAGASIVGAWEVGAAELARSVLAWPDERAMIERFSDALVPTLTPFQDLHKGLGSAMAAGKKAGLASGALSAATAPLAQLLVGLDERADDGWSKTTKHLDPLFLRCPDPDGTRERFIAGGRPLRQACVEADVIWRARLEALPEAPDLWKGLTGAAEAWQLTITRGLEITIDRHAKGLAHALREG